MSLWHSIKKWRWWQQLLLAGATLAYLGCCLFLYYMQSLQPDSSYYPSDMHIHIRASISEGSDNLYSILFLLFRLLHGITQNTVLIVCFLAAVSVCNVFISWKLAMQLAPKASSGLLCIVTWLCQFVVSVYLPGHGYRYLATVSPSLWHNPTYIVMRPLAVLAVYFGLKLLDGYLDKMSWRNWGLFSFFLMLSVLIKPSFLFTFAPALAVLLVIDLIRTRGKGLRSIFLLGCSVLPSLVVCGIQALLLFGSDSGMAFGIMEFMYLYSETPYFDVIRSLLFPALACWFLWPLFKGDRAWHLLGLTMLFGLAEALFLHETGERFGAGNFFWGALIACYFFFLLTSSGLVSWMQNGKKSGLTVLEKRLSWFLLLLFLYHAATGLYHFGFIMTGGSIA